MGTFLPTDVRNSIEDVFSENDKIDGVTCYYKEEKEEFEKDLTLENFVEMSVSGINHGKTNNIWTYYGNITYSLTEKILLINENNEVEEEISNIDPTYPTTIDDDSDFAVVLREVVEWDSREGNDVKRTLNMFIYCPEFSETEEEDPYENAYNRLKEETDL